MKHWNRSLILGVILSMAFVFVWSLETFAQNQKNNKKAAATKKAAVNTKASSVSKPAAKAAAKSESATNAKSVEKSAAPEVVGEESVLEEVADVDVPLKDDSAVSQGPPPDQTSLVKDVQPQMVKMSKDKKFKINFEDELITGAQDKPELETIFSRKKMNFKKMIRLRENFINESEKGKEFFREGI